MTESRPIPTVGPNPVGSDPGAEGTFLPNGHPAEISVIVVTYNSAADLPALVRSLRTTAIRCRIRVIVVDNSSSDGTVDIVRAHPDIVLVEPGANLGYAGGVNAAMPAVGICDGILILNPDLVLQSDAVEHMRTALDDSCIGAVVPRILDATERTALSLRHEPSLPRALGDALFGDRFRRRPAWSTETDYRSEHYTESRDIDWATGAAVLVRTSAAYRVGPWDETYFLYSEETDYFRRLRSAGYRIRYEPRAVVQHRGGGSGSSQALATLMTVNRVRYFARHHTVPYAVSFRAVVLLSELLRSYRKSNRRTLVTVANHRLWQKLPQATTPSKPLSGPRYRGSVIIPAYNEEFVIERTLAPLSDAAVAGYFELIVVCNGCVDETAAIAGAVPGATVIELREGSKTLALNAGDRAARYWPRLYLDADIQITPESVLAVLDRLEDGDVPSARPSSRYDDTDSTTLVRSYFRARRRILDQRKPLWGAGVYGLSREGHRRIGHFPDLTSDDLFVDAQFDDNEKVVVTTEPAVVTTPANLAGLVHILHRSYRGDAEIAQEKSLCRRQSFRHTAVALAGSVRDPLSALDSVTYAAVTLAARIGAKRSPGRSWERDDSSRSRSARPASPGINASAGL